MKLEYKYTLITTLALTSFLFIIIFNTQRETTKLLIENKQASMQRITDEIADHINTALKEKLSLLTALAQTPLLIKTLKTTIKSMTNSPKRCVMKRLPLKTHDGKSPKIFMIR